MGTMSTGQKIFKFLKEHGAGTLGEIVQGTGKKIDEITPLLHEYERKKYLSRLPDGKYSVRFVLDPPLVDEPLSTKFYDYKKIRDAIQTGGTPTPTSTTIPRKWRNPYLNYLPTKIDQGGRGTCFAGRTRILMENFEYKPIKDIRAGERVITHTGEPKWVLEVMKRKWQGNTIKMKVYGIHHEIEATLEHPILTKDGWKPLGEITAKDYVAIPRMNNLVRDTHVFEFENDPNFLWVLGMYLAEGCLDVRRVTFSLGSHEIEYAERIRSTLAKYGAMSHSVVNIDRHVIHLHISGNFWVNVFRELGGELCATKRLPDRMMFVDPSLQKYIFDGWICGDGHMRNRGNSICGVSTSEKLIMQMQHILLRGGIRGNVQNRCQPENRLESFNLEYSSTQENLRGFFDGNFYYSKVRSVEKIPQYMGEHVYNLEVEDNHSYIAETVAVHNCVGFSTAIGLTLLYFDLTKDFPTSAELAAIQRNVEVQLGCANNKPFVHDIFPKSWKSPQFAYWASRTYGNVTVPSGSYLSASVAALKVYGCCFETECQTSKSEYCTTEFYPTLSGESSADAKTRILALAAQHKTDGYASAVEFETFCEAVYNKKWGLVPINIFENYTDDGCTGNYPEPRGAVVGSHAQCVVGYDLDEGTIEFRQSWGENWSDDGGISKWYWDQAAGIGLVVLDAEETKIGQALYTSVTITSNVPCSYTINGEVHTSNPLVVALERGKEYSIVALPINPDVLTQSSLEHTITPTADAQSVEFTFEYKPEKRTLIEIIIDILKKILIFLRIK